MAGASADGEQNPWPAFVDVLTTVIMVVTFLLVIMSAAIMSLSQKIVQEVKQSLGADKLEAKQAEVDQLKAEIERLRAISGNSGGANAEALRAT
jgi:cell division protein FtsB